MQNVVPKPLWMLLAEAKLDLDALAARCNSGLMTFVPLQEASAPDVPHAEVLDAEGIDAVPLLAALREQIDDDRRFYVLVGSMPVAVIFAPRRDFELPEHWAERVYLSAGYALADTRMVS